MSIVLAKPGTTVPGDVHCHYLWAQAQLQRGMRGVPLFCISPHSQPLLSPSACLVRTLPLGETGAQGAWAGDPQGAVAAASSLEGHECGAVGTAGAGTHAPSVSPETW